MQFTNLFALLDAAAGTATDPAQGGDLMSMIPSIIMMVAMVGVFYFILIRPQRKKDKAVKDMLSALKVGDRICTIGGIYGTVSEIREDTVTIVVGSQKTPLVFARWGIRSVEDVALENDTDPLV